MAASKIGSLRAAATSCVVGAAATALGGIAVQAIVLPATNVSQDRWSYPWSSAAVIPISLLWAVLHVFVFYGLLGFARSHPAGTGRSARLGATLALAGSLLAGIATLRARLWRDWRRSTPLSVGIAACALLGLNTTHALPAGVAVYGFCLLALGVALYTEPAPTADTRPLTAQEQFA